MKENIIKKEEMIQNVLTGKVVSTSMKDTVVVLVTRYRKHPKYGKFLVRSNRFKAHDKGNTCALGDTVFIKQCRPISKDKHFIVVGKKSSATPVPGAEEVAAENA